MAFQILSPIHRATRQITLALGEAVSAAGLAVSAEEGHALSYIAVYGPCPTGDVQRVIGSHRSTITSMLDRLTKRALITRKPDPADRRVVLVAATAAGVALAKQVGVHGRDLEERILAELSADDVAALERITAAIASATGVTVVERTESSS